jgi:hypothetical protein
MTAPKPQPALSREALIAALADPATWTYILADNCSRCEGSGVIADPEWTAWWADEKALRAAWETANPGGDWFRSAESGKHDSEMPDSASEEIECTKCRGAGTVPTEAGNALLRFLAAHRRG